jgi:hypothetical protein
MQKLDGGSGMSREQGPRSAGMRTSANDACQRQDTLFDSNKGAEVTA